MVELLEFGSMRSHSDQGESIMVYTKDSEVLRGFKGLGSIPSTTVDQSLAVLTFSRAKHELHMPEYLPGLFLAHKTGKVFFCVCVCVK